MQRGEWVQKLENAKGKVPMLPFIDFFNEKYWKTYNHIDISLVHTQAALEKANIKIQPITNELIEKQFEYLVGIGKIKNLKKYDSGTI